MPMPTPRPDESEDEFIGRCMGDGVMVEEFPDESQRMAVCETQWSKDMSAKSWFEFRNQGEGEHEILIMDEIGGYGISAKDFITALKEVPYGSKLVVGINSPGGDVFGGMAIYNALNRRKNVETRIDGVAASIASVIAMAGDKLSAPKNTILMIHDPSGFTLGTAKDHQKTAEVLDKIRDQIAGVYERKSGMDLDDIKTAMANETWYSAPEAHAAGLVDVVTDAVEVTNRFDLEKYGYKISAKADLNLAEDTSTAKREKENIMAKTKTQVEEPEVQETPQNQTATEPKAAVDHSVYAKRIADLEATNMRLERERCERIVDQAIADGSIKAEAREKFVAYGADKAKEIIDGIAKPVSGAAAIEFSVARDMGDTFRNFDAIVSPRARMAAWKKDRYGIWEAGLQYFKNQNSLGGMFTKIIAMDAVDYLMPSYAPLNAFSNNFLPVGANSGDGVTTRIAGSLTAQAITSGYPKVDATSTAVTVTFTVNNNVTIGINDVDNAFVGGPDMFRNTFLSPMLEGLADPIYAAIWALVREATYTSEEVSTAANFDVDVLADIAATLSAAKAPRDNRSALLPPAYYAAVGKGAVVSDASAYGSTDPIRELVIPRARGFAMYEYTGDIPAHTTENLAGACLHRSAIACAARVPLSPTYAGLQVANQVDPTSLMPIQFRAWFSPDLGEHKFSVANLFGCAVGQPTALVRIASA